MGRIEKKELTSLKSHRIFVINGYVLGESLLHEWAVYVVVIDPSLVPGIIRWIDVEALNAVFVAWE